MRSGSAYWTYDPEAETWYFGLNTRNPPPYLRQITVSAIVDIDSKGRLAGIEIADTAWPTPDGRPIEPPDDNPET